MSSIEVRQPLCSQCGKNERRSFFLAWGACSLDCVRREVRARHELDTRPDPRGAVEWDMAGFAIDCPCARTITAGSVYARFRGGRLLCHPHCTDAAVRAPLLDFWERDRQAAREERLASAYLDRAQDALGPNGWLEIAAAELGLVEPSGIPAAIEQFVQRYEEADPQTNPGWSPEVARARLWALVPVAPQRLGGELHFEAAGEAQVEVGLPEGRTLEPGVRILTLQLPVRLVGRR